MPFVKLDDLDQMHGITFNECLHNYKIYSMDTLNSQNEYNELETLLSDMFAQLRETTSKQNATYIKELKENACNEYNSALRKVSAVLFGIILFLFKSLNC